MSKKTINGMHKSELLTLIKGIAAKLNKIDQALEKTDLIEELYEQIKIKKEEIDDLHDVIFDFYFFNNSYFSCSIFIFN
jgi:uncharacterized coiled-coil DUF342 family protein